MKHYTYFYNWEIEFLITDLTKSNVALNVSCIEDIINMEVDKLNVINIEGEEYIDYYDLFKFLKSIKLINSMPLLVYIKYDFIEVLPREIRFKI